MADSITINSITAPEPGYPVTVINKEGERVCDYALKDLEIWHKHVSETVPPLVHTVALSGKSVNLAINVTAGRPRLVRNYTLTARLNDKPLLSSPVSVKAPAPIDGQAERSWTIPDKDETGADKIDITLSNQPTPWHYSGVVKWVMKDIQSGFEYVLGSTMVEIYKLSTSVPKYISDVGIPQKLLDAVLPEWTEKRSALGTSLSWVDFVIEYLFNHPKLRYETYNGHCTYASLDKSGGGEVETTCWIDLWLSDLTTPIAGTSRRNAVNCYDVASLTQTILALGLTESIKVAMKHMKPYGFIKSTYIIGDTRMRCNNPVWNNSDFASEPECGVNDKKRSCFMNHVFLTLDFATGEGELVFDACAGPQKGQYTVPKYIEAAIDRDTNLYKATDTSYYRAGLNLGPGDKDSIQSGKGVTNLKTPASYVKPGFEDPGSIKPDKMNLLQRIYNSFRTKGQLRDVVINVLKNGVVATYTFLPQDDDGELININIFRMESQTQADIKYELRKVAMGKLYKESREKNKADRELYETLPSGDPGKFLMFEYVPRDDEFFLVTLECLKRTTDSLIEYSKLITNIFKDPLVFNIDLDWSASIVGQGSNSVPLGTKYTVVLTAADAAKAWWVGYYITTEKANNLLLSSKVDDHGRVLFTLLARRPGTEKVTFYMWGPDLLYDTVTIPIVIPDPSATA